MHCPYTSNTSFCQFLISGNDLDSIRALFSEKEKELSLAVAKVEALTKQLEDLRRDRRGTLNLISSGNGGLNATNSVVTTNGLSLNGTNGTSGMQQQLSNGAARELDKLRRELMVSRCKRRGIFVSFIFVRQSFWCYWCPNTSEQNASDKNRSAVHLTRFNLELSFW